MWKTVILFAFFTENRKTERRTLRKTVILFALFTENRNSYNPEMINLNTGIDIPR